MAVFSEPKIDSHCHIVDPARFPFAPDTPYRPSGQEIAPLDQFWPVMETYGVSQALLVGPNSGYGTDNRCLLDALARGGGRLKGVAVVPLDTPFDRLDALSKAGVVGIAFNATMHGTDYYLQAGDLLAKMTELDLFLNLQVEGDQLVALMPLIDRHAPRLFVDHCGRPIRENGLSQPGFQALLALGREGRAAVKLSGYQKFSRLPWPHEDAWDYAHALLDAFSPEACLWASDWPYLRATARVDYGPMLELARRVMPDPQVRRAVFHDTPARLLGFDPP
jgi:predicted TIM-barrel fold metal-dependent hydrolase